MMKLIYEDPIIDILSEERVSVRVRDNANEDDPNYKLDFIPNQETIDAMEEAEAIASGKIETRSYKTFDDMWSDICGT